MTNGDALVASLQRASLQRAMPHNAVTLLTAAHVNNLTAMFSIMQDALMLVSPHGAQLVNMGFMPPGQKRGSTACRALSRGERV